MRPPASTLPLALALGLGLLSGLTFTAVVLAWPADPERAAPRILDARAADYVEAGTGRRLAGMEMQLLDAGRAEGSVFELTVSAVGPRVEPLAGYRGVHGGNHVTARELTALVGSDQLKLVAISRQPGGGKRYGEVRAGTTGRLAERRLLADGRLDLQARSAETYVLDALCTSPPLDVGVHEIYLEVRGLPRLRIEVRVEAATGQITAVECLEGEELGEVMR